MLQFLIESGHHIVQQSLEAGHRPNGAPLSASRKLRRCWNACARHMIWHTTPRHASRPRH
jgi:hypothetical protein